MTKHLYTSTDVKKERERLYKEQEGVDPILKEKIDIKDAVCDHDHTSQFTRAALHRQSNAFEGLVFNAYKRCLGWLTDKPLPEILRNLALYLEQDYSGNPYHTGWIKRITTDFRSLSEGQKKQVLIQMQQDEGSNSKQRVEIFRKALLTKQYDFDTLRSTMTQVKENP